MLVSVFMSVMTVLHPVIIRITISIVVNKRERERMVCIIYSNNNGINQCSNSSAG